MMTVEDLLGAFALAYDTWLDPEVERENPLPEYAYLIRRAVSAENDTLRELVRDMWQSCPVYTADCWGCEYHRSDGGCKLYDRMRELGIEVEG